MLITGAAGFIGGHLADCFSRVSCELILVDRAIIPSPSGSTANVMPWHADINDRTFASRLTEHQLDYVFHLAGNANVSNSVASPAADFRSNVVATLSLLEALRNAEKKPKFVLASSASVYGDPKQLPVGEQDNTVPLSPYGVSKLASERYLDVYCKLYGLRGVSLRIFSPFGPRLRKQVVFDLCQALVRQPGKLDVMGDGTQSRDFIYIDDLVEAIICVAARGDSNGDVYNLGTGVETPVSTIVSRLVDLIGHDTDVSYSGRIQDGYPNRWQASIDKLSSLGWTSKVSIADGLQKTVASILNENSKR